VVAGDDQYARSHEPKPLAPAQSTKSSGAQKYESEPWCGDGIAEKGDVLRRRAVLEKNLDGREGPSPDHHGEAEAEVRCGLARQLPHPS
jgi:hypothetical protein